MHNLLENLRAQLREQSDIVKRDSAQHFFKEPVSAYGISFAQVNRLAKHLFAQIKAEPAAHIFSLCEELWRSGYLEEGSIACEWAYALRTRYQPHDFARFEHWVDTYIHNWAMCDTLCNHSVAAFIEMYPEYIEALQQWAHSENRWKKRAAAVTLILPARKGLFLDTVFAIADTLLHDPDDLVQKGYGWMLKAASQAHPEAVFAYVMDKKAHMPRTAFRYALEKMPPEWRKEAMRR